MLTGMNWIDPLPMLERVFGADAENSLWKTLESREKLEIHTGGDAAALSALVLSCPRQFHEGKVAIVLPQQVEESQKLERRWPGCQELCDKEDESYPSGHCVGYQQHIRKGSKSVDSGVRYRDGGAQRYLLVCNSVTSVHRHDVREIACGFTVYGRAIVGIDNADPRSHL